MNERARASWRRYGTWLAAVLLHIGLVWLFLSSTINQSEPPQADSFDVAIVPLPPPPKPPAPPPKPVRPKPAVHLADKNESTSRPFLRPMPRLAHVAQPPTDLALPDPLPPRPLPAVSAAASPGAASDGSGSNGAGAGSGGKDGNDYLIRLKAYIDSHRGRARHREPQDAEMALVLDQDGMLTDIRVVASSGDPVVDDEIVMQLKAMSPFPKPPAVLFSASMPLLSVVDKWIFPRP